MWGQTDTIRTSSKQAGATETRKGQAGASELWRGALGGLAPPSWSFGGLLRWLSLGKLSAVAKMGASCWRMIWGNFGAPGWWVCEGHLLNPVVQGKQPWLISPSHSYRFTQRKKPPQCYKEQHPQHCQLLMLCWGKSWYSEAGKGTFQLKNK